MCEEASQDLLKSYVSFAEGLEEWKKWGGNNDNDNEKHFFSKNNVYML